jgi:heat shock protein HtpX
MTATLAGAISMLGNFAFFFGGNRENNNNPLGFIGVLVAMIVAPFAAMIVQMASAGRANIRPTGAVPKSAASRLALASALAKISNFAHQVPNAEAERNPATAHMFIINPLSGERMDSLFSTHPAHGKPHRSAAADGARDAAGLDAAGQG